MPASPRPRRPWYRRDPVAALARLRALLRLWFGPPAARAARRLRAHPELTGLEPRMVLSGRPLPDPVIFAGSGSAPEVRAYAADTGDLLFTRTVFEDTFSGGVRVAAADFTRDGYPDLVAAAGPGPGHGPRVRVLDGRTGEQVPGLLGSFWAFEPGFDGGVMVAAADVDGDSIPDVVAAAGAGGGPRVKVVSGADGHVIADFFAYDPDFRGGISVAAADLTGDGFAEIAVGAGPGGGPRVRVYDGATLLPLGGPLGSFFAFDPEYTGGVFVSADGLGGDYDADGTLDLVVGSGPGVAGRVKVFSGATGAVLRDFQPFGSSYTAGARVALAYIDDDEYADVVAGTGPGGTATVRVFSGATGAQLASPLGEYAPFGSSTAGVYVAASNDPPVVTASWSPEYITEPVSPYDALASFHFYRDGSTDDPLTVYYELVGTATYGTDYSGTFTGSFTFGTGESGFDVDLTVLEDATPEPDETVVLRILAGPGYSVASPGEWVLVVHDDAYAVPAITLVTDDTGYSDADAITADTTPTVYGTGPWSTAVTVYSQAGGTPVAVGATTSDGSGYWSLTVGSPLADGVHLLTAGALGATSPPYRLTVDTTPPVVSVAAPPVPGWGNWIPSVGVWAADDPPGGGFAPAPDVVLDVDQNNDGDYADPGETGYATVPGAAVGAYGAAAGVRAYETLPKGVTIRVRARVADAAGNVGTSPSVTLTLDNPPIDQFKNARLDAGAVVAAYPDAVFAVHPLDLDRSPAAAAGTPTALVYTSAEVGLAPVVEVEARIATLDAPGAARATLTWDGAGAGGTGFDVGGLLGGDVWLFDLQPAAGQATGRHTFTVDLKITEGFTDHTGSVSGSVVLVNRAAGAFGAGWSLPGLDSLVTVPAAGSYPGGKLRVVGGGGLALYTADGAGGYDSPRGDAGTLTALGGGGYAYTRPSGEQDVYDAAGRETRWVSADGAETVTYAYDGSGRLATVTSPDGGVATFAYDGTSGLLATVAAPGGRVTTFTHTGTDLTGVVDPAGGLHTYAYDGSHRLTDDHWGGRRTTYAYLPGAGYEARSGGEVRTVAPATGSALSDAVNGPAWVTETDGLGEKTKTLYDVTGRPVVRADAAGGYWVTARDADGRVAAETDPLGQTTTYTRDAAGYVTGVGFPGGARATFTYDGANGHHSLLTATDELGRTTTYTYTAAGRVETATDPAGGVTTYAWSGGLLQTVTDPLGRVTTATYDAARRLANVLAGGAPTGTLLYDAWGNAAGVTDPLGATTTLTFDAAGRAVRVTAADGAVATAVYDAAGLLTGTVAPSGRATSYAYDAGGRPVGVVDGVGTGLERRATVVYDAAGHRVAVLDPLGNRVTYGYDLAGRVAAVTDPLGNAWRVQHDAAGRVVAAVDPLGRVTRYGYDARGRVVEVTDPLGGVTTAVYDAAGNRTAVVDPLGHRTTAVYDALDRPTAVVDPLGNRATAVYDALGRVVAVVDALANRTTATYDARGRLATVVDALGNTTTAAYDAADRRVAVTDPLGRTTTTVYHPVGWVEASVDPLGNRTSWVYDAAGRLSAAVDPLGNRTTYLYDALDRVAATVDALGGRTTAVYDALDRVAATVDPLGYRTTAVYDAASRVVAVVDPLGYRTTAGYDPAGQLVSVTDPLGRTTTFGYEARGLPAVTIDPLGNSSTTTYDAAGRAVAWTDPLGRTTTAVYDAASRVVAVVDPLGARTTLGYDAAGNRVTTTDPLGHTATATYDALRRVVAAVDPLGNRATAVYDAAGQLVASVDPLGNRTTAVYDAAGRLVAAVDPLGNRTTVAYDVAGNRTAVTDPLGNVTTAVYDALNRTSAAVDALGQRTTFGYDAASQVVSVTDPLGRRVTFNYDAAGRRTATLDGLEHPWQTVYDAAGQAVAAVDPLGNRTTAVYDAAGRLLGVVDPLGNRATTVYDATGQVSAAVDPLGNRTTYLYDGAGRQTTVVDTIGNRTTAVYDAAGRTTALVDPAGNRTSWAYDAADRVTAETDPLGAGATFAYDAAGRLRSRTDRLGRRTDLDYDDAGRPATAAWYAVGGGLTQTQTWTYDAAGNLRTAEDPDGTYTLTYDARNRVAHAAEPFGLALTFGYDGAGNRTRVEDSLGGVTTVTFDARNLQTAEELGGAGVTPVRETRAYDDAGRPATDTRQRWSGGAWVSAGTTTYAYDAAGRVRGITHADGSSAALLTLAYAYDAAGRLTSKTDAGVATSYAYDAAWRLTQDGAVTFGYDGAGNRTLAGYATGAGNRLTTDGVWTYTYDAEGNLTKRSKGAAADTWTYGYDQNDQMTTAALSATDGGAATRRVTYAYDALGNRLQRQAWDGSTTSTERYGLDGWDPAGRAVGGEGFDAWADLDGSNGLVTRRVFGPDAGAPAAAQTAGGTVSWYLSDALGSVRGVTSGTGTLTGTATFDAYGGLSAGALSDRYGYAGMQRDGVTGLGLTPARAYLPGVGAFAQEDPLGFAAGDANLRRYVGNSPTNFVDPSGLDGERALQSIDLDLVLGLDPAGQAAAAAGTRFSLSDVAMMYEYTIRDPLGAAQAATLGVIQGQFDLNVGAVGAVVEMGAMGVDLLQTQLAAQSLGANAVLGTPVYVPNFVSSTFSGYQQAVAEGTHVSYLGNAVADGASLGVLPILKAIRDYYYTGNASAASQAMGGVAASNMSAAALMVLMGGPGQCFPAGTLVHTAAGPRAIERLVTGDLVWAFDHHRGEWTVRPVVEVYVREHTSEMAAIEVAGGTIRATDDHPFWVVRGEELGGRPLPGRIDAYVAGGRLAGRWVLAADLRAGDEVFLRDGSVVHVTSVTLTAVREVVYNFRVGELENYAVGAAGVLVHNTNTGGRPTTSQPRPGPQTTPTEAHMPRPGPQTTPTQTSQPRPGPQTTPTEVHQPQPGPQTTPTQTSMPQSTGASVPSSPIPTEGAPQPSTPAQPAHTTTPTKLYAFGSPKAPRPPRTSDFGVNGPTDPVGPETPPSPLGASTFGDPAQAPLTGNYHSIEAGTPLPEGTAVVADGADVLPGSEHRPTHHTIFPTIKMTLQEFEAFFMSLPWKWAGKKK